MHTHMHVHLSRQPLGCGPLPKTDDALALPIHSQLGPHRTVRSARNHPKPLLPLPVLPIELLRGFHQVWKWAPVDFLQGCAQPSSRLMPFPFPPCTLCTRSITAVFLLGWTAAAFCQLCDDDDDACSALQCSEGCSAACNTAFQPPQCGCLADCEELCEDLCDDDEYEGREGYGEENEDGFCCPACPSECCHGAMCPAVASPVEIVFFARRGRPNQGQGR